MEIKDDAAMRGLILGALYVGKERKMVLVRSDNFSPPMAMCDIFRIGCEFRDDELIIGVPSKNGNGYFMRISVRGKAVWEGREDSKLEISGLSS